MWAGGERERPPKSLSLASIFLYLEWGLYFVGDGLTIVTWWQRSYHDVMMKQSCWKFSFCNILESSLGLEERKVSTCATKLPAMSAREWVPLTDAVACMLGHSTWFCRILALEKLLVIQQLGSWGLVFPTRAGCRRNHLLCRSQGLEKPAVAGYKRSLLLCRNLEAEKLRALGEPVEQACQNQEGETYFFLLHLLPVPCNGKA